MNAIRYMDRDVSNELILLLRIRIKNGSGVTHKSYSMKKLGICTLYRFVTYLILQLIMKGVNFYIITCNQLFFNTWFTFYILK